MVGGRCPLLLQVEVENLLYELSDVRRATDQVHASSSGAKPKYTTIELSEGSRAWVKDHAAHGSGGRPCG